MFPAGDVKTLAKKVAEFVDRPLSEIEKQRQADLILDEYNWDNIADKTLNIYMSLI